MKITKISVLAVVCLLVCSLTVGAAWTQKRLTNNVGNSTYADIAVNGSNVYVVWEDNTAGNYEIYFKKSTDNGATWQTNKRLTSNSGSSCSPAIAVNGSNVYVVWEDDTPGDRKIFFRKSADGGATWQAIKQLKSNIYNQQNPDIAVYGSNIYVIYLENISGQEIMFLKSYDGGANWGAFAQLVYDIDTVQIGLAVNGLNVYVVYKDSEKIYFLKSGDGGMTWKPKQNISNSTGGTDNPNIGVSGSNVYVVFVDNSPGNCEIFLKKSADAGATWQVAKRISRNTGWSRYPAVAARSSNVCVAWEDDMPGNNEIFFRKSADGGATWQTKMRLTFNQGSSEFPEIAVSASNIYVVWDDSSPGNWEIYLKYLPL